MLRGDCVLNISAIPIRESVLSQMYARCQSDDEDHSRCCLIFPWISQCGRRQLCGRDAADVHPASVQDPDSSPSTSSQSHPGMGGGMNISYPKHLPSGLRFSIARRKKKILTPVAVGARLIFYPTTPVQCNLTQFGDANVHRIPEYLIPRGTLVPALPLESNNPLARRLPSLILRPFVLSLLPSPRNVVEPSDLRALSPFLPPPSLP